MKHFHILIVLLFSATTLLGQRIKPDKRIRLAPDTTQAHALISDHAGRYQHTLLYHWIDSVFHISDSTIWVKEPTHIYYLDPVSVGTSGYKPTYQFSVDGTSIFKDYILIEHPSPSLFFSNDTSNIDAGFILLNDSTFSVTSIARIGWGGNGISAVPEESLDIPGTIKMRGLESTTPSGSTKMLVVDTVGKVAFMADIPTPGFDSTYIYAALSDSAADIRAADSDHQQLSIGSDTIYLERGGFIIVPLGFDSTHIYQALADSASDIRDDMPFHWDLYVEGSFMRYIGDDLGDIVDFVSGDNSIDITNVGSQLNFSTTESDPIYAASWWPGVTTADTLRWGIDLVDDADADPTNELFDSTHIYQALVDSAADIRADIPTVTVYTAGNGLSLSGSQFSLGDTITSSVNWYTDGLNAGFSIQSLQSTDLPFFRMRDSSGQISVGLDVKDFGGKLYSYYDLEVHANDNLYLSQIGNNDTLFIESTNIQIHDPWLNNFLYEFPGNAPTDGQLMKSDANGILSWQDDGGGSGNDYLTAVTHVQDTLTFVVQNQSDPILLVNDISVSELTNDVPYVPLSEMNDSLTWISNANDIYNKNSGNVGIGTSTPDELLHLQATADPAIKLTESGGTANHLSISNINASTAKFDKTNSSGAVLLDFFPNPSDGTSTAKTRFFRNTNTTGRVAMDVHKGDNTSAVNCSLSGNDDSYVNKTLGDFGVGTSSPVAKLHVTGGDIYVEDDGAAVILTSPNGTCYEVTVDNSGNLVTTSITCP